MSRIIKQILYGMIYFAVFGLVVWGIFGGVTGSGGTCFDKVRNQNEAGVDCGGTCGACIASDKEPLRISGDVKIFNIDYKHVVLLGGIENPNSGYHASQFFYRFTLFGKDGKVAEVSEGKDLLYASEKKYEYAGQINSVYDDISRVTLEVTDVAWQNASEEVPPVFTAAHSVVTTSTDRGIRVSGTFQNQSPFSAPRVKIIAVLLNAIGDEVFASQTVVENVQSFTETPFVVSFPFSASLNERADMSRTVVFISSN